VPTLDKRALLDLGLELKRRKAEAESVATKLRARLLAEFSPKLHCLFEPHPYKISSAGRYSTRSWSYADAILDLGLNRPLRIVGLRETMRSLEDSVHTLLADQIKRLGLEHHYQVYQSEIRGKNGTEIFYAGLHGNAVGIKSMEGCDIFWVEEAQTVSKSSWETLIPTVRKPGAELWISMNPRFFEDDSYQRWVVNPPASAKIIQLSWRDNKYLTDDMREKMAHLKVTDPEMYEHVYEGATLSTVQDAVYKAQIQYAEKNGHFCNVVYDARIPVNTYWDLGWGDMVSVWFAQTVAFEHRLIDYYENNHQEINHYLQVMQSKGYVYGTCVFPWDGGAKHVSTGKSTADIVRARGFNVRVLRQGPVAMEIENLRTIFPQLYFAADKCAEGIAHLRRYQWGPPGANGALKREPLHDQSSHAARALGCLATDVKNPQPVSKPTNAAPLPRRDFGSMGWAR
jgi:phage terminase large subunit